MKAVIYEKYGKPNVLKLTNIKKPIPKDNEVLVKVVATSVTAADVRLRASDFPALFWLPARIIFGLFKPNKKILGHEFSGIIEEKGKNVTKFNIDDAVFGTTTMLKSGAYAEYLCVPETWKHGVMALKPKSISFKHATCLPIGGMTALFLLEKATISKNKKILIYGASGSVGSYAVQLAKHFETSATGVCSSKNMEMVKNLGADNLLDYNQQDYATLDEKYDIVFDAVGKTTKSKAKKVLKKAGVFVSVKMMTKEKNEYLLKLADLTKNGKLIPFIDKVYPLENIVKAHKYVDTGRKRGNVIIEINKK
ncbi:NAD(P)-dependent alcohol dehydrogenase [Polaribacter porphyrae]|uniref:NAD(P)-dependent alcohol dehydrogenase n=1 Tax=Polaribacter porphyrae TaxID=1137780 RepID=A0A2S7WR60_9FLAO|nr:NAD(P)-dependent alcohol dehydrogenase [Polaribacter porphyrae]PQJ80103.1 NAD(P)-dependent alcohol dehydrogenase [Polaribacter porphyrae]